MQSIKFMGLLLLSGGLNAQPVHSDSMGTKLRHSWGLSLEGMVGVSFGRSFVAFNVGGPSLLLRLNKDLKIGVGALPSIYWLNGKAGARLGVSPRLDYKDWVFIAPFYHRDRTDEWIASVGLGYKFHRK